MMNEHCAVVQDLLPSYVEGLLREESRAYVEAHLAECEACSAALAAMRADIGEPEAEPVEDAKVLQAMRKSYRSIRVRDLVIAVVVGVAVFAGAAGLWNFLQNYQVPVSGTEADLFSIGETPDAGEVYWQFGSSQYTYSGWGYSPRLDEAENVLYLELNRSLLGRARRTPEAAEAAAGEIDVVKTPELGWELNAWVGQDGRLYTESGWLPVVGPGGELLAEMGIEPDRNAAVEIQKIYIGSKDDYRLVWQAGDEIGQMRYDPKSYRGERPVGAPTYDTDLRVATASEGRAIMEAGLNELGIDLPPYELTYPNWNGMNQERYETRAEDSPYSMHQHASAWDSILAGGIFFRSVEAADLAGETLHGLWTLAMRSVYPELSDIDAEKMIRKLENNLELDTETNNGQWSSGVRLGEYSFKLVWDTEERLGGYLQISYLGTEWPERE